MTLVFLTDLGDKMSYKNAVVSKVPRPSRMFQMGILRNFETRFQELAQTTCPTERHFKEQVFKSKALLLDLRHVLMYQSFDCDIREKMLIRADAIVNYINAYMDSLEKVQLASCA